MGISYTPRTWTANEHVLAQFLNNEIGAPLTGMQSSWQSFPVEVDGWLRYDGTVTGAFMQVGKTVHARTTYIVGSDDFASPIAAAKFTMPLRPHADYALGGTLRYAPVGSALIGDASASLGKCLSCCIYGGDVIKLRDEGNAETAIAGTPWTWEAGDYMLLAYTYEAA
jgi:hypothetical protein